jgi:inner membrane protein
MSPITHFLTGWMVANLAKLDRKDRAIVTLACVVPDIDGLGIIPELLTRNSSHPLLWFTLYHHSLHTLAFALVVAVVSFVFARQRCRRVACSVEFSPSSVGGLGGIARTGWVSMAYSLSSAILFVAAAGVGGQWGLNSWPNVAITAVLLAITLWLAWRRGFSPLEMVSTRADAALITALRRRFPGRRASGDAG